MATKLGGFDQGDALPDVLGPGLRVVFCGTAAGAVSAVRGAYTAGQGNRLWKILEEIGLTPYRLEPCSFRALRDFGIGLTDIAKTVSGADSDLPRSPFDVSCFRAGIRGYRPRIVASLERA
jgi:TDG/mug DNA glycosylase family protein